MGNSSECWTREVRECDELERVRLGGGRHLRSGVQKSRVGHSQSLVYLRRHLSVRVRESKARSVFRVAGPLL